jgi:lipoprotein-releasing system permease protein
MKMLFLAWRHLISRKRQTVLTLLGIAFGSMAFVTISGFMLGFQNFLLDQLVNNDAHVRISAREDLIKERSLDKEFFGEMIYIFWQAPPSGAKSYPKVENPGGWERRLNADSRVVAYSPQLSTQVIFSRGPLTSNGRLLGSQPGRQSQVTNIRDYMTVGKFEDIGRGGNRLVVGDLLAKRLGVREGDTISVATGNKATPCKIAGIFSTGSKQLDETTAYGLLSDAQSIASQPNVINNIAVRLADFNRAASVAGDWQALSTDRVESWDQINASFLNVFAIQDATRYLMIVITMVVAGFGIYNILNVVVSQKKREIAILRSMGFEQRDISQLFLLQGTILGLSGAVFGMLMGYIACLGLAQLTLGSGPLGNMSRLKIDFDIMIYLRAGGFGLICSILASILPSLAAGRMSPIDIIRGSSD